MSDQWRILVVEDEENLNWSIVNSLRKDGYFVQGVMNGAEAVRILWSEEYDVVISDLKMPGADGFELLQWVRTHRPRTRLIMATAFGSASTRNQALEGGVVSYLEKPFDLHTLKEELRRLLQQTGFSASLDSFDLLDVIQIITMSRKSIALLVNTGLEERGVLRFQGGELIWAEYGTLRGEEAFFALAAHKNGVVIHQPWNEQIMPNVTQPLSRLIFQALQYRTKYAALQQHSSELEAIGRAQPKQREIDDRPFLVLEEPGDIQDMAAGSERVGEAHEWWQQTVQPSLTDNGVGQPPVAPGSNGSSAPNIVPSTVRKTPASQRADLPSWLMEQPTHGIHAVRASSPSNSVQGPQTPFPRSSPAEWGSPMPPMAKTPNSPTGKRATGPHKVPATNPDLRRPSSPEWQPTEPTSGQGLQSGTLKSLLQPRKTEELSPDVGRQASGKLPPVELMDGSPQRLSRSPLYVRAGFAPALVSALQTLGYSVPGFVATAVITQDGQPIAQVTLDDLDISSLFGDFSSTLQGALRLLEHGGWGGFENTIIMSAGSRILLRLIDGNEDVFHVLVTTREADPLQSLEAMASVEATIGAALR